MKSSIKLNWKFQSVSLAVSLFFQFMLYDYEIYCLKIYTQILWKFFSGRMSEKVKVCLPPIKEIRNKAMMYSPTLSLVSKKMNFLHTCKIIIVSTSFMDEGFVAGFVPLVSPRKASFLMLKLLKCIDVGFVFTLFDAPKPTADFLRADILESL